MSKPTQSILPIILNDVHKTSQQFSTSDYQSCYSSIQTLELNTTLTITPTLTLTARYAGHALGAIMIDVELNGIRVLYSGDYDISPSYLLRGATLVEHPIDLFISESTCINEFSKKRYEMYPYITTITETLQKRGKGHEVMGIVLNIMKKLNMNNPICCSGGLLMGIAQKYKEFSDWIRKDAQDIVEMFPLFQLFTNQTNCIIITTPASLTTGHSCEVFKLLSRDPKNSIILPSYVTFNQKQLKRKTQSKIIHTTDNNHTDGYSFHNFLYNVRPKEVMLVHGESSKIESARSHFEQTFNTIPFHTPELNSVTEFPSTKYYEMHSSKKPFPPKNKEGNANKQRSFLFKHPVDGAFDSLIVAAQQEHNQFKQINQNSCIINTVSITKTDTSLLVQWKRSNDQHGYSFIKKNKRLLGSHE
ncbi:Cleavage and polyadenylation specificity factor [Entamoeba marina]